MTRRSQFELAVDLLDATYLHPKYALNRVCAVAHINHKVAQVILTELEMKGFLVYDKSEFTHHVKLAERGLDWLKRSKKVLADYRGKAQ